MIDVKNLLNSLSLKRPIFHLEADFQHALAWELHLKNPDYLIRLEYKPPLIDDRLYLDIFVCNPETGELALIELKYKTRKINTDINGEKYALLNQSAQDLARYDFLKDVNRIENLVANTRKSVGYAIFLTNDSAYWKIPVRTDTVDSDFRIHEGIILHGNLKWSLRAARGTTKGRESQILIKNRYKLKWQNYSKPIETAYGQFKYLIVKIAENITS